LVITGGEPTLYSELPEAIKRIKAEGFLVKLDTNGTNPKMLKELLDENLLDYVAMDLKAPPLPEEYLKTVGIYRDVDLEGAPPETLTDKIKESLALLKNCNNAGFDYEIRTTVVPTLLDEASIFAMSQSLIGMKKWVIQQFVPRNVLNKDFETVEPYSEDKLREFIAIGNRFVPTKGRGF